MKKFLGFVALSCVITIGAFMAYNLSKDKVKLDVTKGYEYDIKAKGLSGAKDISIDEEGNVLVAFENEVRTIRADGKENKILLNRNRNIQSIMYNKGNIFYISGNSLFQYNIKTEEDKELLSNLPNSGEYKNSKLAINEDKIYISIGAATNSGVAEDGKTYDLSPIKITLKGKNFDGDKTGAFVEYGTKTSEGQVVKAAYPGNASIITYNINNSKSELFAWGIRNIKGWDFYSTGELFGIVGGMENRGLRPIKSDVDYIYNIKKGYWYGWPDYSGGDPVTSPRFNEAESEKTTFLLDKHPTVNPEAPFYQSERIDSLQALTIDKQGDFFSENAILFFDKNEKRLFSLTKDRISSSLINIKGNGEIIDIEKFKDRIFLLEKNEGIIYEVYKENKLINTFSQRLLISIISILLIFIITIIIKVNLTKEVK